MIWTLFGYFPKRRVTRAAWVSPYPEYPEAAFPAPLPVEEIASVSNCIARGPEIRMDVVPCNQFGGYATPEAAWQAVDADQRPAYDLYAYRVAPMLFEDGHAQPLELQPVDEVAPLPDGFCRLGYDAVELTLGQCLGCSPLSCNGQTQVAAVNRYCLVDTQSEGVELARTFSVSKPEPGPYVAVEVWRDATPAGLRS